MQQLFPVTQNLIDKDAFRNLKVLTTAGLKYVLKRNVKHRLDRTFNFLKKILRALFRMRYVLLAWEQPGVIPAITVVQKDLSSCRSLNILDTFGKVSEFMLARTISDLRSQGLLRDEQV